MSEEGGASEIKSLEPRGNLRQVLNKIDRGMPGDLHEWGEGGKERVAKKKEFRTREVEENINKVVVEMAKTPAEQQRLRSQFALIYEQAFQKLYIPGRFDKDKWRYDDVFAGLVDNFMVVFPQEMLELTKRPDGVAMAGQILEITTSALEKIQPGKDSYSNSFLPYDTSCVTRAVLKLTTYAKSGRDEEGQERMKHLDDLAQEVHDMRSNSRDMRLLGERTEFITEAQKILPEKGVLPAINNLVKKLKDERQQLFVDMTSDTLTSITRTAKNMAEKSGVDPVEVIQMIEQQLMDIGGKDTMASVVMVRQGLPALAEASEKRNYSLDQARQLVQLTADFLCGANTDRRMENGYVQLTGVLQDGSLAQLMEMSVDGLAQEVIHDVYTPEERQVPQQVNRVRQALNTMAVVRQLGEMRGVPVTDQRLAEVYRRARSNEDLPWGMGEMRIYLQTNLSREIHPASDGGEHFLTLFELQKEYDFNRQAVVSYGLEEAARSEYLSRVTFEQALKHDPVTFAKYVEGLGILANPFRRYGAKEEFETFIPHPESPEGQDAVVTGVANVAEIYRQTTSEEERDRLDELFKYVLANEQLRIPFFMHLNQGANLETMRSLSWVVRLAKADEGLKSKVDRYLSEALMDSEFKLPGEREELKPELSVNGAGSENSALATRVDTSMPLGKAISIIAGADNSAETGQQVGDALGKVELHSIEDAETLSGPIIAAFVKYLHLDAKVLQERMFTFRSGEDVAAEFGKRNAVAGIIAGITDITGGGPIAGLAYDPEKNNIIVSEKRLGGFTVDELGEEIMHWVRDTTMGEVEYNPVVQEFWGFVGRRIARAALRTEDTHADMEMFEEAILENVEQIMGVEHYHYLDIGYKGQLASAVLHAVGYAAGSNVPLDSIPEGLIEKPDDFLMENYLKKYGPDQKWFEKTVGKVKDFYKKQDREWKLKRTKLEHVTKPIKQVLDLLPYVDQKKLGI